MIEFINDFSCTFYDILNETAHILKICFPFILFFCMIYFLIILANHIASK